MFAQTDIFSFSGWKPLDMRALRCVHRYYYEQEPQITVCRTSLNDKVFKGGIKGKMTEKIPAFETGQFYFRVSPETLQVELQFVPM